LLELNKVLKKPNILLIKKALQSKLKAAQRVAEVKSWLKHAQPDEKKALLAKLRVAKAKLAKASRDVLKK